MKRIAVVANQLAGNGSVAALLNEAKRSIWGWKLDCILPRSGEELERVCRDLDP